MRHSTYHPLVVRRPRPRGFRIREGLAGELVTIIAMPFPGFLFVSAASRLVADLRWRNHVPNYQILGSLFKQYTVFGFSC